MMYYYPFGRMNPYYRSRFDYYSNPRSFHTDNGGSSDNKDCHNSSYVDNKEEVRASKCHSNCDVNDDRPVFNLFGIRLYFDDLLLLALIYFLYAEDVHDPELFIALILLLLS